MQKRLGLGMKCLSVQVCGPVFEQFSSQNESGTVVAVSLLCGFSPVTSPDVINTSAKN